MHGYPRRGEHGSPTTHIITSSHAYGGVIFVGSFTQAKIKSKLPVFGALVISSVDNFLKPMIIGGRTRLPALFLLLTILGSVSLFGFSGIILGPVLLALLVSFIEIYKQQYRESAG